MPIPKKLLDYLDKNGVRYEAVAHRTTYTALDSAETQHLMAGKVIKTLVMKLDAGDYVLALLPADRNLDKAKFLKAANTWRKKEGKKPFKKADFAKEAWMKKNIMGKIGATPPFGKLLEMPSFADNAAMKNSRMIVNSGDYEFSLELAAKQFEKLEEPAKGSFSVAKKIKKQKAKKKPKQKNKASKGKKSAGKNKFAPKKPKAKRAAKSKKPAKKTMKNKGTKKAVAKKAKKKVRK